MKIDNRLTTPLAGEAPAPTDTRAAKAGGNDAAAGVSVEVRLSELAAQLQAIQGRLADSEAPVDAAKVAEIRQAIAEGRFRINADAIADRLLDTVRELIEGPR